VVAVADVRLRCPQCGTEFDYEPGPRVSAEDSVSGGTSEVPQGLVQCPNCGFTGVDPVTDMAPE
jgi:rubredoxin